MDERKRRMEEAQVALGRKTNTRIADLCYEKSRMANPKSAISLKSTMRTSVFVLDN